jgi:hypothetical protein
MGNFQFYDALSILFELEKPPLEHLEVSSFYRKKVASYIIFSKLLIKNSSSRTQKNSPIGPAKASASMVGGLFAITTMSC